jgi:hypothetical protein
MSKAKDYLTVADLGDLEEQFLWKQKGRRHIRGKQRWNGRKLDSIEVTIDVSYVMNVKTVRLDVDNAELGQWLIATTYGKAGV